MLRKEKFGKVSDYPAGGDFYALLRWHMAHGTRPTGSRDQGVPWNFPALSTASYALGGGSKQGFEPRTANGWLSHRRKPYRKNFERLVEVFFGSDPEDPAWRNEFCRAYEAKPPRKGERGKKIRTNGNEPDPTRRSTSIRPFTGEKVYRVIGVGDLPALGWDGIELLSRMVDLDYACFDDLQIEQEGTPEQWAEIFLQHPYTWRAIVDECNQLVGYWQSAAFFPDVHQRAREGHLLEQELTEFDYEYLEVSGIYDLYIVSICLAKDHRNPSCRILLLESFFQVVDDLAKSGTFFAEVCVNAYSDFGLQLSRSFRLKPYKQHQTKGQIYLGTMWHLLERYSLGLKKSFPNLIAAYREVISKC